MMVVQQTRQRRANVVATPAIKTAPRDGSFFDDGYAFSANGGDGTITMVDEKYQVVATIPTQKLARTIAADQKAHKLYLPAAGNRTIGREQRRQERASPSAAR